MVAPTTPLRFLEYAIIHLSNSPSEFFCCSWKLPVREGLTVGFAMMMVVVDGIIGRVREQLLASGHFGSRGSTCDDLS